MLRGRVRKFALENGFNLLTENATDKEDCVRFALVDPRKAEQVIHFIQTQIPDAEVTLIAEGMQNPVLSKMKVNKADRYSLK